ncbi:MAG TPA: phenylalanine--tRNA ligase subunit beta [Firmicutes bacterium]|nr:phenylalanine--tRNA ligase subunit beta [Bacillota bacterium]
MLVPLEWLQEYAAVDWSAEELGDKLTAAGLKLENIHYFGIKTEPVVVGRILTISPHPAADRLVVCTVDIGTAAPLQVVTGAPNIAVGINVPTALPGAKLATLKEPVREITFRGVKSQGVLCAEDELGISDDHSGVMVLPPDLEPGADVTSLLKLGDAVLDIEIYPNRADCLSIIGLAREVAAIAGVPLKLPKVQMMESDPPAADYITVTVAAPDLCPRYCARVIRGVRIGRSPLWMERRLKAAGMRPINNVVDITNYVMLEMGQPLHAFDLHRLHDSRLIIRRAGPGEVIRTLDNQDRRLDEDMLVIADGREAVAVAGVMGGEKSEISPDTQEILLESATFAFASVRKTSRKLGLRTEASNRFEKGLDPHLAAAAADRAAALMAGLCGGQVAAGLIDVAEPLPRPQEIRLRPHRVNRLLGTSIAPAEMKEYLTGLGFAICAEQEDEWTVTVPTFRRDVTLEADLVEEVGRRYGYDRIPATIPGELSAPGNDSPRQARLEKVRQACMRAGLSETITYSFTTPRHFDKMRLLPEHPQRKALALKNPLSEDQSILRTTLAGNLLEALAKNAARQSTSVHLFEIGAVYLPREWPPEQQPEERTMLGAAMMGEPPGTSWAQKERRTDFYDLKEVYENVLAAFGIEAAVQVTKMTAEAGAAYPYMHPGRTAIVQKDVEVLGYFGEVHPLTAKAFDLPQPAFILELDLGSLIALEKKVPYMKPLPRYPAVFRDLALVVPDDFPAAEVEAALQRSGGEMLVGMQLFDVYQGPQVPSGHRSLAFTLTFRAEERTLTDDEVTAIVDRMVKDLAQKGLTLRI